MGETDQLGVADFPLIPTHAPPVEPAPALTVERPIALPTMVPGSEVPIAPLPSHGTLPLLTASGDVRPLEEMEHEIIRFAIAHYRGQMSEVARRLKIGRSTLYRKLDEANGETPSTESPPL